MTHSDLPDDTFFAYHQLWRSLLRGTTSPLRLAIPAELVRMISWHAGLIVLDRKLTAISTTSLYVRCSVNAPTVVSRTWFWAGPIDIDLANIAQFQLVTKSCDQGWTTDTNPVSRTWFDVGIFPLPRLVLAENDNEVSGLANSDGLHAVWQITQSPTVAGDWSRFVASREYQKYFTEQDTKHWHCSHFNPFADGRAEIREGLIFTRDHAIWKEMAAGHIIAVRVCAKYLNWMNRAQRGELKVWRYFEPVINV
ncbi:hypothetical protein EIP86_007281 [Pleurotus ostreatoroseus]|nr:hypothetical protein EIP86_007281 [Pleurotus ostreatoroseus]